MKKISKMKYDLVIKELVICLKDNNSLSKKKIIPIKISNNIV